MAISTATFVDALRQNQLLSPTQLDEWSRLGKPGSADPRSLAQDLCARGWLTHYQAQHLLSGQADALVLGPYVLLHRLGAGGMGQVFKARHGKLGRTVALKVIRKENVVDAESVGRFQREMHVTSRLEHPNVVRALDAGPLGGTLALVMEYVEGTDLDRLVKERGPLSIAEACDFLRQAALGLQHIHEHGLIHRDIKPSNLMVTTCNRGPALVKILDLGLARLQDGHHGKKTTRLADGKSLTTLTLDGAAGTLGSIDYLSPEQALDFHRVDIRGDIYSLGCTFFFMLTGQPPFGSGSLAIKLMRHQQAEPPDLRQLRPEAPTALCDILRKMLAKQAGDRYQSPAELLEALRSATTAAGPPLRATSANRRRFPLGRRRRWAVVGGCLGLVGLLLAYFVFSSAAQRSSERAATPSPPPPISAKEKTAPRKVEAPREVLLQLDFEDGKQSPLYRNGRVVKGPQRPGKRFCLESDPNPGHGGRIFLQKDDGLFTYKEDALLVFDLWVDAQVSSVDLNLWNRTQKASQGVEPLRVPREQWVEGIVVPVAHFKAQGVGGPKPGDVIVNLTIHAGQPGTTIWIDNLEVVRSRDLRALQQSRSSYVQAPLWKAQIRDLADNTWIRVGAFQAKDKAANEVGWCYDADLLRFVRLGGRMGVHSNEVCSFELGTTAWTINFPFSGDRADPVSGPSNRPGGGSQRGLCYDRDHQCVWDFCGNQLAGGVGGLWQGKGDLGPGKWSHVKQVPACGSPRVAYDENLKKLVCIGMDGGSWGHTYVYSPDTSQVAEAAADPSGAMTGRVGLGHFPGFLYVPELKDCLLVAGMPTRFRRDGGPEMTTWLFETASGKWRDLAPPGPLPSGRAGMGLSYDRKNRVVVLFGGTRIGPSPDVLDDAWIYDPARNTWALIASPSDPRHFYKAPPESGGDCQLLAYDEEHNVHVLALQNWNKDAAVWAYRYKK
jgi:serine/threonine protein kinase